MLRWSMQSASAYGAAIKAREEAEANGRKAPPIPPELEPPELLPGLNEWYEDFIELSTDRQLGFGAVGQIPKSSIDRHVEDWPYDDAEMFRACIRAMDAVYIQHTSGKDDVPPDDGLSARDAFKAATQRQRTGKPPASRQPPTLPGKPLPGKRSARMGRV